MYELSENLEVNVEPFQDSFIYTIDNFFKDPYKILSFMKEAPHTMWQGFTSPNHNGKYYKYKKIFHHNTLIYPVIDLMMPYFQKGEIQHRGFVLSDYYLFDNEYNDYQNKYFWPHKDFGWTGVVYLNHYEGPGTNMYREKENVIRDNLVVSESESAWLDKSLYTLEKPLMSKFNRCVFFDAFKFHHNMAVDDRTWFNEHRYNVVIHFKHGEIKFYNHGL
jgi:hypothetical protein